MRELVLPLAPAAAFSPLAHAERDPRLVVGGAGDRRRAGGRPLPFEATLETEFTVRPAPGGAVLRVRQGGFQRSAAADEFYAACQRGWEATFGGLHRFVSTLKG
jgi:hypothetical protein